MLLKPDVRELVCDVLEAIEKMNKWRPLYLAVLKETGDKKQAAEVVKWADEMEQEIDLKRAV